MNHSYKLEYKNIIIRPLEQKDIEALRQWRNTPSNTQYLRKLNHITIKQQKHWYKTYLANDDEICFAIDLAKNRNKIIGSASLYNFQNKQAEFGKLLVGDLEAHGQKVGYNTTKAVLNIAFNRLLLQQVILRCYRENAAALHIYKQAGFKIVDEQKTEYGLEYLMLINREYKEKNYDMEV